MWNIDKQHSVNRLSPFKYYSFSVTNQYRESNTVTVNKDGPHSWTDEVPLSTVPAVWFKENIERFQYNDLFNPSM